MADVGSILGLPLTHNGGFNLGTNPHNPDLVYDRFNPETNLKEYKNLTLSKSRDTLETTITFKV